MLAPALPPTWPLHARRPFSLHQSASLFSPHRREATQLWIHKWVLSPVDPAAAQASLLRPVSWHLHVSAVRPLRWSQTEPAPQTHSPHTVLLAVFHQWHQWPLYNCCLASSDSHLPHTQQAHHWWLCTPASEGLLRASIFTPIATVPVTWPLTCMSAIDLAILTLDPVFYQNIPHTIGRALS